VDRFLGPKLVPTVLRYVLNPFRCPPMGLMPVSVKFFAATLGKVRCHALCAGEVRL